MSKLSWTLVSLCVPVLAAAQSNPAGSTTDAVFMVPSAGSFVIALMSGLILAVAFQLILTNLSVAAGLNILGGVTSPKHSQKESGPSDSVAGTAKKISSAFGIWTLVTASIALFFACWLAGELSLTASTTIGAVLGLVIWGLFYVFMMTIEASAVSSLVGTLGRMAMSGLRTAFGTVTSVISKSDESKAADTAAKITSAVRDELFGDVDISDIKDQIQKYVTQLKPPRFDVGQIRRELAKLLDDTEIQAVSSHDGGFSTLFDRDVIMATLKNRGMDEENAGSIVSGIEQALSTIKEERLAPKDTVSKVIDTGLRMTGMSGQEAQTAREKFEEYLRNTGKEELNPEGIKRDIEKLFTDRKEGIAALKSRASGIDKSTAVAVLTQRDDMTQEEAQRIVDQVEKALNTVSSTATNVKSSVTDKVRSYLNSLERPELNFEGIEQDMRTLFSNPKEGGEALLRRLKAVDRNTVKAIIASRDDMSEEDAERIVSRIEAARDNAIGKFEQMAMEVQRRLEAAKDETLHQADEARKVAATAAWWAFATALVSAVAAAVGGMVSAMTL